MAGLSGLKFLLLSLGLIGLKVHCDPESPSTPSPSATTTQPPPAPTTSTLPASTPSTKTATTPSPACTYTVEHDGKYYYAVIITTKNEQTENYTVEISGMDMGKVMEKEVKNESQTFSVRIPVKQLKPCSTYNISVTPNCHGKNHFKTEDMTEEDIEPPVFLNETAVCVNTTWMLSECVARNINTSCTPHTFSFQGCNSTVNKTFLLPPVKPEISYNQSDSFAVSFIWTNKPSQCGQSLSIECTINGPGGAGTLKQDEGKMLELEPFQSYNCTGKLWYETEWIKSDPIEVKINCAANFTSEENTTSITLRLSSNCSLTSKKLLVKATCGKDQSACSLEDRVSNVRKCSLKALGGRAYKCEMNTFYDEKHIIEFTNTSQSIKTHTEKPRFSGTPTIIKLSNNGFTVKCTNLTEDEWMGLTGKYTAELQYSDGSRVDLKTDDHCFFTFTDLYYLTEYKVKVTAINGDQKGPGKEAHITGMCKTQYNDKAVLGILGFLIIVTSVALFFVLFKIYNLRKSRACERDNELVNLLSPNPLLTVEPITADNLLDTYKKKIADEGRLFLAEFQSIPRIFSNYTIKEAKKQENQPKNRYVDILPYDYNRVQLSPGGGHDYINASFIDGYKEPKKYIAAQGPKDETVGDFWRMVWEQQASIIVMVTRCEEGNRNKCAQYWPSMDRETEIFDDFVVKIKKEDSCPDYIIRHLTITNRKEKSAEREVTHIQFTSWPDHGVPGEPHLLLKLRRRVNSFNNFFSGPIVVHCSAGVGRTGTYIGIDAMMESLESENRVDIYGYVVKLRRQRCLMVQVEAQYILIHQALIEYNQFGETEVCLSELHSTLNRLRQKDSESEPSCLLEAEFQRLPKYKNWRTFNTGSNEENKKKNRSSTIIPYDYNRVLVKIEEDPTQDSEQEDEDDYSSDEDDEDSTKYINASFIDGYWCPRGLIAAQGPLADTVEDFLQMVYQKRVKTIVMLSECTEDGKEFCSQYWDDEKKTFGEMEVTTKECETAPTHVRRHLELRHAKRKEVVEVEQYQFLKWSGRDLPEKTQDLTDMIKNIKQKGGYGNSKSGRSNPIVVHCNDGSSRSGVFCALWNIMDSAETEKLIDVFQAAKSLRRERQGMLTTYEEYEFLYQAIEAVFPVQNGDAKLPTASAQDTVQIVSEVSKEATESTASNTNAVQQEEPAATSETGEKEDSENSTPAAEEKKADADSDAAKTSESAEGSSENKTPGSSENTTNGPTVTVEI